MAQQELDHRTDSSSSVVEQNESREEHPCMIDSICFRRISTTPRRYIETSVMCYSTNSIFEDVIEEEEKTLKTMANMSRSKKIVRMMR